MKKILIWFVMMCMIVTLVGCSGDKEERIVSDGSQDSIFDSISDALKDVFEKPDSK